MPECKAGGGGNIVLSPPLLGTLTLHTHTQVELLGAMEKSFSPPL